MTSTSTTTSTGTSTMTSWDESPAYGDDAPLPRLARAEAGFTWSGDLAGTSTCRYAFAYAADGTCAILGFEHLEAEAPGGEPGTLVLRHEGTFAADGLAVTTTVVDGSGTGGLAGVAGTGTVTAPTGSQECSWALELARP
jgi:hypothetical protein